jgi:hypothetical protein
MHRFPALELRHDTGRPRADIGDRFSEAQHDPLVSEVIRERLHDLGIDEVEQHRPLIDQRHLGAEGAQHRRVFQPDHTADDDDGGLRNALELVDRVSVENPWRTDRNLRVFRGPAATRDQDAVRRKPLRAVRRLHAHGAIVGEARLALGHEHAVTFS